MKNESTLKNQKKNQQLHIIKLVLPMDRSMSQLSNDIWVYRSCAGIEKVMN